MPCKETVVAMNTALALVSAILIASYILFGGSFNKSNNRRKKFKKGLMPGLLNTGNTCFLNCVLQSMASSPLFIKWLLTDHLQIQSTILINALGQILNTLNKDSEDDLASASEVMLALRSYGWKISLDEQDAHELFLALMQTLNDELDTVRDYSNSLFNVSWMSDSTLVNSYAVETQIQASKESANFVVVPNKVLCDENSMEVCSETTNLSQDQVPPRKYIISKVSPSLNHDLSSTNYEWLECPFKGYISSHLQCSFCGFKKPETLNTFNSLSLSIPDHPVAFDISLRKLLDEYIRPERITDVTCDGCSKMRGTEFKSVFYKQLTLAKLPECLCIHIQRTTWIANGYAFKKNDFICIPLILNMAPYTYTNSITKESSLPSQEQPMAQGEETSNQSEGTGCLRNSLASFEASSIASQQFASTSQIGWKDSCHYSLKAVIVHMGDLQSGHFVTYRKGNDETPFKDKWFFTSDGAVKEVDVSEVLQVDAYMIIYEKVSV